MLSYPRDFVKEVTLSCRENDPSRMKLQPQAAVLQAIQAAAERYQSGNLDEAQRLCQEALRADPENAHALHLYGLVALGLGDARRALQSFEKAVRLDPSNPTLLNNLGQIHRAQGRVNEAESCFRKALDLKADYAEAGANLGTLLHASGRMEQSAQNYLRLGLALETTGQLGEAVQTYRQALTLERDNPQAHHGLGRAHERLGRLEDAVDSLRAALALKSDWTEVHHDLGNALFRLGRLEDAEQSYRRALALSPGFPVTTFALSQLLMLRGDYRSGLPLYESRFEGSDRGKNPWYRNLMVQLEGVDRWKGERLEGRALLVWTEQGLGDTLMVMRYLPLLKQRGAERLIVYCEPAFVRLIGAMDGVDEVVSKENPLPLGSFDRHCPLMSLPLLFDTRLETIPGEVPYARVPAAFGHKWADRFAPLLRPRVGLVWAGGALFRSDPLRTRSVSLERFSSLLGIGGASFVSLQKGDDADQIKRSGTKVHDWMDECEDFLDTAAVIEQLDLVISVDTAVAHLAGALGKPVWMLNRFESEWRWMLEREDSPWYPTMRIFRQSSKGEWDDVIARVASALNKLTGQQGANSWLWRLFVSRSI